MATIKFNEENFLKSVEPGICSFVISAFEKKLREKLTTITEEVYAELREELPDEIKAVLHMAMSIAEDKVNIRIELNV